MKVNRIRKLYQKDSQRLMLNINRNSCVTTGIKKLMMFRALADSMITDRNEDFPDGVLFFVV